MPFHNLAREYSTTTGTADAVLTTAVPGCNTWDLAGVTDGEVVCYGIITYSTTTNRPTHSEVGLGTYTTATKTLARTTVESSTAAGAKITLTGLSEVFILPSAAYPLNLFAVASSNYDPTTVGSSATSTLDLDTELTDDFGIISLAADVATVALAGWYEVHAVVSLDITATASGRFTIILLSNGASDDVYQTYIVYNGFTSSGLTYEAGGTFYFAAGETIAVQLGNLTSNSIDAYVQELRLVRLGA